ncbi:MAG: hypothetical protein FJ088_02555 [Deltaproteobacteria bacterium]|nr:hypothetical protein [Deltaproteobacteria bacterium]
MNPVIAIAILMLFCSCRDKNETGREKIASRSEAVHIVKNCGYDDVCFEALRELKNGRFKPSSQADHADVALAEIKIFIESSIFSFAAGANDVVERIAGIVFSVPVAGPAAGRITAKTKDNLKFLMKGYSENQDVKSAAAIAGAFLDYKCGDINRLFPIPQEEGIFQNTASLTFLALASHFLRSAASTTPEDFDAMRKTIAACMAPGAKSPAEQTVEVLRLFNQNASLLKERIAGGLLPALYSSSVEAMEKWTANLTIPVNYEYTSSGSLLNARLPMTKWNAGFKKIPGEIFAISGGRLYYAFRAAVEVKEGEIVNTGRNDFEEIFDFNRNYTGDELQYILKDSLKEIFRDFDFANQDREIYIVADREESLKVMFSLLDAFLVHGRFFFNLGIYNENFKETLFLPVNYRYPERKITLGDGSMGKYVREIGEITVETTGSGFTIKFPGVKSPLLVKTNGGIFDFAGLYGELAGYRDGSGEANVVLLFDKGLSIGVLIKTSMAAHFRHYANSVSREEFERGFLAADPATGKAGFLFKTIYVGGETQ